MSSANRSSSPEPAEPVLQRYGVSDEDAFSVGLTCGGILDVYVEKVDRQTFPELGEVAADIAAGRPVAARDGDRAPRPRVAGPAARRTSRGGGGAGSAATAPPTPWADDARGCWPRATTPR